MSTCTSCGADVLPNYVITEQARRTGDTTLWLTREAANARFCRYAKERGKDCANDCTAIDPRHTFEARCSALDAALSHPEITEFIQVKP